ncbi:tyrosine-type recombinase/integrase [Pseudomonas veronii]|uniref:tyrosine-type recombinase/integrase n=1 Tax=Pseudomonas veronii TaxID=76761 RepID=UPI002D7A2C5E|nr:tyrosine-type recombinase/integrase [Pseudomonas veronii]WRU61301.1 tyrosine-type recombinase/integrase [Pseudomonas veronii]
MRVPVYPQDLAHNRGFKTLAKKLSKNWCCPNGISIEVAQEILSKGLGYRDFFDLRQEAASWASGALCPPEVDVKRGILSAAEAALKPGNRDSTGRATLEQVMEALPLSILTAFKAQQHVQVVPVDSTHMREKLVGHLASQGRLLTADQLQRITSTVTNSGNLRDGALLDCFMSGWRASETLNAKVGHCSRRIRASSRLAYFDDDSARLFMYSDALKQHVRAAKLADSTFLFSSKSNPESPMSTGMLSYICADWADKAYLDRSLVTPSIIRYSAINEQQMKEARLEDLMGHKSPNHSQAYLKVDGLGTLS